MYTAYYVLISKTTDTSMLQTNLSKKVKKKNTTITSHTTIIEYSPLHTFHNAITGVTPNYVLISETTDVSMLQTNLSKKAKKKIQQ